MARPVVGPKQLLIVGGLVLLALLRAEQGVAELKGRPEAPSRLLYAGPTGDGSLRFSVFGFEWLLSTQLLRWPVIDWKRHPPDPSHMEKTARRV